MILPAVPLLLAILVLLGVAHGNVALGKFWQGNSGEIDGPSGVARGLSGPMVVTRVSVPELAVIGRRLETVLAAYVFWCRVVPPPYILPLLVKAVGNCQRLEEAGRRRCTRRHEALAIVGIKKRTTSMIGSRNGADPRRQGEGRCQKNQAEGHR